MIIECSKCGRKYNISDEKIGDTTKRFPCKKCDMMIIIHPKNNETTPQKTVSTETPDISKKESASRFARVLASDMFEYNKDTVEQSRRDGNLLEAMEEEIVRSWELWKKRYPLWSSKSPDIFRDALNYFLADGEDLFAGWHPPPPAPR